MDQVDFLEEKEEFGLGKQNTMMVGKVAHCGLRWVGWFDRCPKAERFEDPGTELPTLTSTSLRLKAGH